MCDVVLLCLCVAAVLVLEHVLGRFCAQLGLVNRHFQLLHTEHTHTHTHEHTCYQPSFQHRHTTHTRTQHANINTLGVVISHFQLLQHTHQHKTHTNREKHTHTLTLARSRMGTLTLIRLHSLTFLTLAHFDALSLCVTSAAFGSTSASTNKAAASNHPPKSCKKCHKLVGQLADTHWAIG